MNNFIQNPFLDSMLDSLAEMVAQKIMKSIGNKSGRVNQTQSKLEIPKKDPDDLLKREEVCNLLKVSLGTLNNLRLSSKLIPDTYLGRSPRYRRSSIDTYLEKSQTII